MRIIAGKYGSRVLKTLDGDVTRPTQDKIKEAIFSRVGPYFENGKVLDLFGGSGALGLECISRGMSQAIISDINAKAIQVIKQNVKELKVQDQVVVEKSDYQQVLNRYQNEVFNLIFIDPPYAVKKHQEILVYIAEHQMLSDDGYVVVETSSDDDLVDQIADLIKVKEKKYGITKIHYYRRG